MNKSVSNDCIRNRCADCDFRCCCFRFATLTYLERFMNMRELANGVGKVVFFFMTLVHSTKIT